MKVAAAAVILTDHFLATFVGYPIELDNAPLLNQSDPYVRFTIQFGDSKPNLDSSYKRTMGIVIVRVMVPKGGGDLLPWQIAQLAADALELRAVSGVRLTSAGFVNVGLLSDGLEVDAGWYQINVNVPFWFDHVV